MRKIFFITGPGRCGTKLLSSLLDGNEKFHVFPGEVTNFFKMCIEENGLKDSIYAHSYKKICDSFLKQVTRNEFKDKNKIYLNLNSKFKRKFRFNKFITLNAFLTEILDTFYNDKKPVVINVHDENFLGLLDSIKHSKIIHMLRNPFTQINSRYMFRYRFPQNYDGVEFSSSFLRNYNSFKNAYISLGNERVLIVKMEDLLKNIELEMKKILKFMSLDFKKINLITTKSGRLFDTKQSKFINKKSDYNFVYKNKDNTSCLLPNDMYVISKIKYVKFFYKLKKIDFSKQSFIKFYLRHLGFIGNNRSPIMNPWRLIKNSIYSVYLFYVDKSLKDRFLKYQNL